MKYVIIPAPPVGFFSLFNHILATLSFVDNYDEQHSELYNRTPIVYIPDTYYLKDSINLWELFFEDLLNTNMYYIFGEYLHEIKEIIKAKDSKNIIIEFGPNNTLLAGIHNCGLGFGFSDTLNEEQKIKLKNIQSVATKYIHPKPFITDKVNKFYNENMKDKCCIGIHFRATDKPQELLPYLSATGKKVRILPIDVFIEEALKHNPDVIFLATDCEKALSRAKELTDKIIHTNCNRSNNDEPLHKINGTIEKCGEVIVDCYLLSRCNHIIHSLSNIPQSAFYLNSKLTGTFLV